MEQIGQGGFARVFRAKEKTTGRKVALKVLKDSYLKDVEIVERFRREAFAVASISSPHVVELFDFGISGQEVFLAMEFVEGVTLRQVMHERSWSCAEIHLIVGQIAQALSIAHRKNIVHRDLKPENVMLVSNPDGTRRVKVLDFGLAKLQELERDLGLEPLTRAGMCFGTPQYMSPEQIRGKPVDSSGDLYALGVICYEMLTGCLPWDGPDSVEVMQAVIKNPAPAITKMHPSITRVKEVSKFVQRALAKDKKNRPPDATHFFNELEVALYGESQPAARGADKMPVEDAAFASVFAASIELVGGTPEDQTVVELSPPEESGKSAPRVTRALPRNRDRLESKWVQSIDLSDFQAQSAGNEELTVRSPSPLGNEELTVQSLKPVGFDGKLAPDTLPPLRPYPGSQETAPMARVPLPETGTDRIEKQTGSRVPIWVLILLMCGIAIGGLGGYLIGRAH